MDRAVDSLELTVDVADPLELLVDLCRPTGAFLPCAARLAPGGRVGLCVRLGSASRDPLRVSCVVVDAEAQHGTTSGLRARFPNADTHAATLLRTFAPVLAERAPVAPRQQVVLDTSEERVVRALAGVARGGTLVVPTQGPLLPGERIALTVGNAWTHGVLMIPLLAIGSEAGPTDATPSADGDGFATRAKPCDDVGRRVVARFLERVARAIVPRETTLAVV